MEKKTEYMLASADTELQFLKKYMKKVSGKWNRKDGGRMEEVASCANEIIERCDEMRNLLDEFSDYNYDLP